MDNQKESSTSLPSMKAALKEDANEESANSVSDGNDDTPVEDTLVDESPLIIPPGMKDDEDDKGNSQKADDAAEDR